MAAGLSTSTQCSNQQISLKTTTGCSCHIRRETVFVLIFTVLVHLSPVHYLHREPHCAANLSLRFSFTLPDTHLRHLPLLCLRRHYLANLHIMLFRLLPQLY
jgi:hypothetical protein